MFSKRRIYISRLGSLILIMFSCICISIHQYFQFVVTVIIIVTISGIIFVAYTLKITIPIEIKCMLAVEQTVESLLPRLENRDNESIRSCLLYTSRCV